MCGTFQARLQYCSESGTGGGFRSSNADQGDGSDFASGHIGADLHRSRRHLVLDSSRLLLHALRKEGMQAS